METTGERVDCSASGIRGGGLGSRLPVEGPECENGDPEDAGGGEIPEEAEVVFTPSVSETKRPRPIGRKAAKEDQHTAKQRELSIRLQAKATSELAAANSLKAETLRDQAALSLFTMPNSESFSEQTCQYIEMRRDKEMEKLKERTEARKVAKGRLVAAAAREARANAAEVTRATANRVVPPPMAPQIPTSPLAPSAEGSPPRVVSPSGDPTLGSQNNVENQTLEFSQRLHDSVEDEGSPTRVLETQQESPPMHAPTFANGSGFNISAQSLCDHNQEAHRYFNLNSLPTGIQAPASIASMNYTYPHQFQYFGGHAYSPQNAQTLQEIGMQQVHGGRAVDSMAHGAQSFEEIGMQHVQGGQAMDSMAYGGSTLRMPTHGQIQFR